MSRTVFNAVPADSLAFWQALHKNPINAFYFGPSSGAGRGAHSDIFMSAGEPASVHASNEANVARRLSAIKRAFRAGPAVPRYVGFFGFEAGRAFDAGIGRLSRPRATLAMPAAWFGDFRAVIKIDVARRKTILFTSGANARRAALVKKIAELLRFPIAIERKQFTNRRPGRFRVGSAGRFAAMVREAKAAIASGDIYQANLSLRFERAFRGDPVALYRRLSESNPSPYACLIKMNDAWIVSSSPELLLRVEGARVVTRPIAGTRPRGKDRAQDRRRHGQLLLSPKERAEHVMLVDLERNDLGRVCRAGSVRVTERAAVERYSHVMHIVSQVEGRLARGKTSADALAAIFPGGTITGCPKIKSIDIIQRIERQARGPFYGSAGFFCTNGDAVFNILIRTALIQNGKVFVQAGAGIVADSHPRREYREVLAKAKALVESVEAA